MQQQLYLNLDYEGSNMTLGRLQNDRNILVNYIQRSFYVDLNIKINVFPDQNIDKTDPIISFPLSYMINDIIGSTELFPNRVRSIRIDCNGEFLPKSILCVFGEWIATNPEHLISFEILNFSMYGFDSYYGTSYPESLQENNYALYCIYAGLMLNTNITNFACFIPKMDRSTSVLLSVNNTIQYISLYDTSDEDEFESYWDQANSGSTHLFFRDIFNRPNISNFTIDFVGNQHVRDCFLEEYSSHIDAPSHFMNVHPGENLLDTVLSIELDNSQDIEPVMASFD